MFLGSYLQQSSEQRQKRNDPSQRGVSLSEAIKGRGVLKKSLGPVKEEGVSDDTYVEQFRHVCRVRSFFKV